MHEEQGTEQESEFALGAERTAPTHRERVRAGFRSLEPPLSRAVVSLSPDDVMDSFRENWNRASPAIRASLKVIDDQAQAALEADAHAAEHIFNRYGCYIQDAILHDRFSRRRDNCLAFLEPMAIQIVRTLDDLIGGLVVLLEGRERSVRAGPMINRVPMVQLLDAVGNYVRHHQEWRNAWLGCIPFEAFQTRSMLPLAQALSVATLKSEAAYAALAATERPILHVLDLITDFDLEAVQSTFAALEAKLLSSAADVIAQCFPRYEQRVERLGLRAYKLRRRAQLVYERARASYPGFLLALDERLREFLPTGVSVACTGLEKGTPRWTNGVTFVEMAATEGTTASIAWGELDEVSGAYDIYNMRIIEETCEIDMDVVDDVAAHVLADWLACDHRDSEGYPAFAEGYIPSWERWKTIAGVSEDVSGSLDDLLSTFGTSHRING
jgi:hypothetical protein